MSYPSQEEKSKKGYYAADVQKLEDVINKAVQKVGGSKENDLCKYIPVTTGGYIHHFTLRKMKTEEPVALRNMIEKFITNTEKPNTVTPKTRAPRGTRKRRDQVTFSKGEVERMLALARTTDNKDEVISEIISKLTPKKSLAAYKRELISSIKAGRVVPELWNAYVESVHIMNNLSSESMGNAMPNPHSPYAMISGKAPFSFPGSPFGSSQKKN